MPSRATIMGGLVLGLILGNAPRAQAEELGAAARSPSAAQRRMSQRMHHYFRGELDAAAMALGLSAGSGWAGGVLLAHATDASRAAAVPVLALGAVELAIGIGLYARTPSQVDALDDLLARDPQRYAEEEGARMSGVVDRFGLLTIAETTLLVAGAMTTAIGAVVDEDRAIGAGLGTVAQASMGLTIDALAAARAERYLDAIHDFRIAPAVDTTDGAQTFGLVLGGAF